MPVDKLKSARKEFAAMKSSGDLGRRLQKLRKRQQRTLASVAEECGFTKSLLSKIERNRTMPTIATLMKISHALGVEVSDLLNTESSPSTVHTLARDLQEENFTQTDKGYGFHLFAGRHADKLMQPFLIVAHRGRIKPGGLSHGGEEFIYVLSGEMAFRVAQVDYRLGPGDSLYFDSEQEHDLQPLSEKVVYLAVFADSPPMDPPAGGKRAKASAKRKHTGQLAK